MGRKTRKEAMGLGMEGYIRDAVIKDSKVAERVIVCSVCQAWEVRKGGRDTSEGIKGRRKTDEGRNGERRLEEEGRERGEVRDGKGKEGGNNRSKR